MITDDGFTRLVTAIERLGFDEETAADYAARIGDTPCLDESGLVVVSDATGRELARLRLEDLSGWPGHRNGARRRPA